VHVNNVYLDIMSGQMFLFGFGTGFVKRLNAISWSVLIIRDYRDIHSIMDS